MSLSPRIKKFLFIILVAVIGIALLWTFTSRAQKAAPSKTNGAPAAIPVVVAHVGASRDALAVDVVGSGLARRSVTIYPAVAGEVDQVLFAAGARVKAGAVLVQLVDRQQRLAERLAAAEVEAAKRLLQRYQATRGTGAVSASVIDEADSNLQLAEIRLAQAREALADRTVRAPFAGVVGIAQVDPGDRVGADTALTTLDDRQVLAVDFDVPERFIGQLNAGQKVELRSPAFPEKTFTGAIDKLDSRIDLQTRSLRVRARVDNRQDLLRPGMSFSVRLELPAGDYLRVPELALQWSRDGGHVWTVRDGRAQQVPVRVVRRIEGAVVVDGALRAGEPVVVEGVQRLRPGRQVNVLEGGGAQDAAAQGGAA